MQQQEYIFSVEGFSGPFDLLLELAKQHEIEISQISLDLLIDQYLDFIKNVQEQGLDVRSSYLEMAAELLRLKSAQMLSYYDQLDLELEEEDLEFDREEMVRRLLEYKRYKEVIGEFNRLIDQRGNFLSRTPDNLSEYREDNFKNNFDVEKFHLATQHYLQLLNDKQQEKTIQVVELNVEDYINHLKTITTPVVLDSFVLNLTHHQFITLFLAILESLKLGYIDVEVDDQCIISLKPKEQCG